MSDQTEIQKLLRLKRYEQPEPEYFKNFLAEFQSRQRSELLKRSLWSIVCDRASAFTGHFTIPQYAYGAASAAVLVVAGVISANILSIEPAGSRTAAAAAAEPAATHVASVDAVDFPGATFLSMPGQFGEDATAPGGSARALHASVDNQPRYVLDARPVSYEAPFSF